VQCGAAPAFVPAIAYYNSLARQLAVGTPLSCVNLYIGSWHMCMYISCWLAQTLAARLAPVFIDYLYVMDTLCDEDEATASPFITSPFTYNPCARHSAGSSEPVNRHSQVDTFIVADLCVAYIHASG
jgi:hypothetical protein